MNDTLRAFDEIHEGAKRGRHQGDDIVPLVGARRRDRLEEALGALAVTLSAEDLAAIEEAVPMNVAAGARYNEYLMGDLDSEKKST